jgi:hypothetical protein
VRHEQSEARIKRLEPDARQRRRADSLRLALRANEALRTKLRVLPGAALVSR